jgi:hypothetical protein
MRGFNYKKAVQALNYFAIKSGGTINKMKAIKLIWLSDRLHLRKFGRFITGDDYYALPNGPVPSATRDVLENSIFVDDIATDYASEYISELDKYNFHAIIEGNYKVLSKSDVDILDIIYTSFGHLDHFALSDLSHFFPEWKKHESALSKKLSSRFPIDPTDFFINFPDQSGLFVDSIDDLEISKSIFEQNNKIFSLL